MDTETKEAIEQLTKEIRSLHTRLLVHMAEEARSAKHFNERLDSIETLKSKALITGGAIAGGAAAIVHFLM